MRWLAVRLVSMCLPALAVVGATPAAFAEGEACLRDSECAAPEHCFEGVCAPSKAGFASCSKLDTSACEEGEVCAQGACKRDEPVCRNELGVCFFGDVSGECQCVYGPGVAWDGDPPDVGSPSDDPTGLCFDALAAICPPDVPEPMCGGDEERARCEAFVEQENALNGACGGTPYEDPLRIVAAVERCCDAFDDPGVAAYLECLIELAPDDCAGFEACAGAETDDPTGGMVPDEPDEPDEPIEDGEGQAAGSPEDEPELGCRLGASAPGPAAALLVMLGLVARRRQ